jgi:D-tyrosyl-tRNA(Tyr) deacylase
MKPEQANAMYRAFGQDLEARGISVKYGVFGAMMDVSLINDGPVTIVSESKDGVLL